MARTEAIPRANDKGWYWTSVNIRNERRKPDHGKRRDFLAMNTLNKTKVVYPFVRRPLTKGSCAGRKRAKP
jgi:hypothetical protein